MLGTPEEQYLHLTNAVLLPSSSTHLLPIPSLLKHNLPCQQSLTPADMELTPEVLASTKEQTLEFNPLGPRCYKLKTFFRLCGDVQTSYLHTDLCIEAISSGLGPGAASLPFCWNTFPLGKHLSYCVGECERCQTSAEPGVDRPAVPWKWVQVSDQTSLSTGRYTIQQIRDAALKWRAAVEQQEYIPRTERLRMEREAEERRRDRELEWNRAWEHHQRHTDANYPAPPIRGSWQEINAAIDDFFQHRRAKILDLTDDFTRPRTSDDLLERVHPAEVNPEDKCFCDFKLSKPGLYSDDNDEDIPVRFQGGCRHVAHYKCLIKALTTQRPLCMSCRELHRFVLKNGFDDPKFRWIVDQSFSEEEVGNHVLWQISGYIPFHEGLNRRDQYSFKTFEKEDRWGDLEVLPLKY